MVTRKEVAVRAGVSEAVVSYVMNNRKIVKEGTRQKVLDAVQELGYRPNKTAISLKTKKTGQLAVLVNFLGNPFEAGLLLHIEEKAKKSGYTVFFHTFTAGGDEELKNLLLGRVDGVLLLGQTLTTESLDEYKSDNVPLVSVTRPGVSSDGVPSIDLDWVTEFRRLIVHLREQGHGKIGFLSSGSSQSPIAYRLDAFREAMQQEGLALPDAFVLEGRGRLEEASRRFAGAIAVGLPFTAVVCANDLMAAGCLEACRIAGLRVPDDLAVAGCEDILMSSQTAPPLTSIRYPRAEAGRQAVTLLLSMLEGAPGQSITLEGSLAVRNSTVRGS